MAKGGARNRSGPQKDPSSLKSAQVGFVPTALPSEGYAGDIPDFPLPGCTAREAAIWEREWRSPVAAWWATRSDLWIDVALFVRFSVKLEGSDVKGTDIQGYLRLKDQIGRSPAGAKENGLAIARNQIAAKVAEKQPAPQSSARDRMKVVKGADSA